MSSAQKKAVAMRHLEPLPDMTEIQFRQWVSFLERRTGTTLPPERKSFLVTNLGMRMREIGCRSYDEYFALLEDGISGLREWSVLVDRLTVHETRFFRHPHSLDLVRQYALEKPVDPRSGKVSLQAWSVACSTGEEAYSIAMVMDQVLRTRREEGFFGITATDISNQSLQTGRNAIYTERRMADLDPGLLEEYFERTEDGRYQVIDRIRKRVCFARVNAMDIADAPVGDMDIIYCQNLLIYFDRGAREQIVASMIRHLVPGGLLILGSGELLSWGHPQLQKIANGRTLAYRKMAELG